MTDYSRRIDNRLSFTNQVFELFTKECGGFAEDFAEALYSRYTVEGFHFSDDHKYFTILNYFIETVVPHKIAVFKAGMELVDKGFLSHADEDEFKRNLWLHDLSKFSAIEGLGYAFYDFKNKGEDRLFNRAWHHHKMNNPHHPEYWANPGKEWECKPIPMPYIYIVEMIADWIGAGKTYGNTLEEWLPGNLDQFSFHQDSIQSLTSALTALGFHVESITEHRLTCDFR